MAWNDGLLGVHLEIAADSRSPLHVLAGPGTGKTYALMRRIARLLETGTAPEKILAVTFTRTAARDLKEQLEGLGISGTDRVRASTLHSLCYSILQHQVAFKATGRVPRPLLSYEQAQLVNDLADQFGGKTHVKELLEAYEAAWARLQCDPVGPPLGPADQAFEAALKDWLIYHRSILIGELVPLTLTYLRQNPVLNILPEFAHVLVDEYQDLNRADQELVVEFARPATIIVSGDDNQSIYSFRYANPEGIRTFPDECPGTTRYIIEECRRCPSNIVQMSNALIRHNQYGSRGLPIRAVEGRPSADVYIVRHQSVDIEVEALADFIDTYLKQRPGLPAGQVLVLATRRFIGHSIRQALIARGHNALSYFFEDELTTQGAAEGFCLLTLLVNPTDRAALRAWIGLGQKQNGSARAYARIRSYAQSQSLELHDVIERLRSGQIHLPYTAAVTARCRKLHERLLKLKGLTGLDLVRALWSPDDHQCSDIRIIAENLAMEHPQPDMLHEALLRVITHPELPGSNGDIIRVMSLHKSKGLTAALVVIAGCVSGALPTGAGV